MSAVGSSAMSGASRWLAAQPSGALLSTIRAASAAAAMRDRVGNRCGLIICVPFALSPGRWLEVTVSTPLSLTGTREGARVDSSDHRASPGGLRGPAKTRWTFEYNVPVSDAHEPLSDQGPLAGHI